MDVTVSLNNDDIRTFRARIWDFYQKYGRHTLPWRINRDPYHVLVSEIMLQQTQVSRVLGKYPEFIRVFPDFNSLARADLREVLSVWKGMGYNRRAIALKNLATWVISCNNGRLPGDEMELVKLPGIGKTTASSVVAFAFDKPVVFIETNIRRVFIHCFFSEMPSVPDKDIRPLVACTLDPSHTREWYYALMDFGSHLAKTVPNPNRRSAHYYRQPPFEGSTRQARGRVIETLLGSGQCTVDELACTLETDPEKIRTIVSDLEQEGFLVIEDPVVRMK